MEHPLITNADTLTVDELSQRITDLTQKYRIAQNTGNAHLCQQILMALETYRNKFQEKTKEMYAKQTNNADLSQKIQIR